MEQFSNQGIAFRIRQVAYDHLRLGSPDEAEALHQLRNSVHFDEFDDFIFRSYQTLFQGQMVEFTSLAGSLAEVPQPTGRELSDDEQADWTANTRHMNRQMPDTISPLSWSRFSATLESLTKSPDSLRADSNDNHGTRPPISQSLSFMERYLLPIWKDMV